MEEVEKKIILKKNTNSLPAKFSVPTLSSGSSFTDLDFLMGVSSVVVVAVFPFLGVLPCNPDWFQTQSLYHSLLSSGTAGVSCHTQHFNM